MSPPESPLIVPIACRKLKREHYEQIGGRWSVIITRGVMCKIIDWLSAGFLRLVILLIIAWKWDCLRHVSLDLVHALTTISSVPSFPRTLLVQLRHYSAIARRGPSWTRFYSEDLIGGSSPGYPR